MRLVVRSYRIIPVQKQVWLELFKYASDIYSPLIPFNYTSFGVMWTTLIVLG